MDWYPDASAAGVRCGIAQVEVTDMHEIEARLDKLRAMEKNRSLLCSAEGNEHRRWDELLCDVWRVILSRRNALRSPWRWDIRDARRRVAQEAVATGDPQCIATLTNNGRHLPLALRRKSKLASFWLP